MFASLFFLFSWTFRRKIYIFCNLRLEENVSMDTAANKIMNELPFDRVTK